MAGVTTDADLFANQAADAFSERARTNTAAADRNAARADVERLINFGCVR